MGPTKVIPAFSHARAKAGFSDKNSRDVQVGFDRALAHADLIGFIGFEAVQPEAIFLGVDADRAQAEFIGRAKYANGDFAAVGSQQFLDVFCLRHHGGE